jgi:uncharacterized protein YjlB
MKIDPRVYPLLANGSVPNNPSCPLLVYPAHADSGEVDLASYFERLFSSHCWSGAWRNGIFAMHHWHNTAHEVLGIYAGRASVQFGGESGPVIEAETGDVIIVPAGVAHKRLSRSDPLGVVGAYADGRHPDICTPESEGMDLGSIIASVPLPVCDPVYGAEGPLHDVWRAPGESL